MKSVRFLINFTLSMLAFSILIGGCSRSTGIHESTINNADYSYLADELNNFNLPEDIMRKGNIVYKSVATNTDAMKKGVNLYVLRIPDDKKDDLIGILEDSKTLLKGDLSDDILFALKAGDKESFDIDVLQPERKGMKLFAVNKLDQDQRIFSTQNLYYHYQRFRVYQNPSKEKLLENRKKFIMFELAQNRILYYNCFYKYQ